MSIETGIDTGQQIALQVTAVTPQMTVNTGNSRYPDIMNSIFGDQDTYATIFNQFFGALSAPATGVFQFDLTRFSTFALNNLMFASAAQRPAPRRRTRRATWWCSARCRTALSSRRR